MEPNCVIYKMLNIYHKEKKKLGHCNQVRSIGLTRASE